MTQFTVHAMMLTDARPIAQPTRPAPRWRLQALVKAWEWSRRNGLPYSPFVAVKAV